MLNTTRIYGVGHSVRVLKLIYMKKVIILLVAIIIFLVGLMTYFLLNRGETKMEDEMMDENSESEMMATSTEEMDDSVKEIGRSSKDNPIMAYSYGEGDKEVIFVGGIHGGYSWNTSLVSYELMDYLEKNKESLPSNVKVTVIPALNPDGLSLVAGTSSMFLASAVDTELAKKIDGRLNGNGVDLNRNFDCDWQSEGTWQSRTVSGGAEAFSEPEAAAFRDYVAANKPAAVVVWYASAGGVFASSCHNDVLSETKELTNLYAKESGYRAFEEFDFYEITGDMVNWLAKENIPAISVLLTNHTDTEWTKNRAGIDATIKYVSMME